MNYLAHLYLSGENEPLKVGNFIGDYVKGKQYLNYKPEIQKGILLHRQIDSYTDNHNLVKDFAAYFRAKLGRYSVVVSDILFDHFLAKNWINYSNYTLRAFSKDAHAVLLSHYTILPVRVKLFLPFLIQHRRLESYTHFEGLYQSLHIMAKRTSLPDETDFVMEVLQINYKELQQYFERFFEELTHFVEDYLGVEIKKPVDDEL